MRIRNYAENRRGAGIVEYGLIVGLVAVGAVVAVDRSGQSINGLMTAVAADLRGVNNAVTFATGGPASAPPAETLTTGCSAPGEICDDGTVYAADFNGLTLYVSPDDDAKSDWGQQHGSYNPATTRDDGAYNTNLLVADGRSTAAPLCDQKTSFGHDDWYLASLDELTAVSAHAAAIGNFRNTGDWREDYYYTSSNAETYPTERAWAVRMADGHQSASFRSNTLSMRCVRSVAR